MVLLLFFCTSLLSKKEANAPFQEDSNTVSLLTVVRLLKDVENNYIFIRRDVSKQIKKNVKMKNISLLKTKRRKRYEED